jgi:hypothetical protein
MPTVGLLIVLVVSAILLWAGLEKIRAGQEFAGTLSALGMPAVLVRVIRPATPIAEVLAAVGLVVTPSAPWPRLTVLVLAVSFAGAGIVGLRAEEPVRCSCFGTTAHRTLGWFQLAALPAWLLAVGGVTATRPSWSVHDGIRDLVGLILALGAVRATTLVRLRRLTEADRLAFRPAAEPMSILAPVQDGGR